MQLASKGLGTGLSALNGVRQAPSHLASGVRSLHVPLPRSGPAPTPPGAPSFKQTRSSTLSSIAGRILQSTRNSVTGFVRHLTTPGFTHPIGRGSLNTHLGAHAAVRSPTIHQRLSVPARHALSTATKRPYVSQHTFQVGLGLARNFSSARPFFQNIVQNVPVTGRALYNVDLDIERKAHLNSNISKSKRRSKSSGKENKNLKHFEQLTQIRKESVSEKSEEQDRYFAAPCSAAPGTTTVLLIPLAPTPSSRVPLSDTSSEPLLLPFTELSSIITSHHMHSLRVSTLFSRLDAGGVWEKGVHCSAHGDASGLCTVLRIEFAGWTEAMVRKVIGESGKGWCRIVELYDDDAGYETTGDLQSESGLSSIMESNADDASIFGLRDHTDHIMDSAHSFILPTLDFSSSFVANGRPEMPSRAPSFTGNTDVEFDAISSGMSSAFASTESLSDLAFETNVSLRSPRSSDVEWGSVSYPTRQISEVDDVSSSNSWIAFSSDFVTRSNSEPRENLFY
ncbi:hypothetical protein SCHPADRAFT_899429 [Schizopora paradoxa]|uniref:Uncharacterized protein n=1 Tax=Schizopora paradoxa TaxID=27342 RepID=A0A0H2S438_9AGAM|nr:hypothetical protein SCHPADRAFT_899429 [Schizopora paradoxa]